MKYERVSIYSFISLLILPNIIWIFLDQHVWPWDQAWYGQVSVNLYYQATHSFSGWWHLMLSAFGMKAPAIAWFGQMFVPLAPIFGSIDRALLVFILGIQFLTLIFLYKLILLLMKNDKSIAVLGCIGMASAPLFIGMGNQYFVESLQLFAVVVFLYVGASMKRWSKYDIILALLFIIPFFMAVKITSPIYVLLFSFFVLPQLWKSLFSLTSMTAREYFKSKIKWILYGLAIIFLFFTVSWYAVNWKSIYSFMQIASSGSAAELYGSRAPFLDKMILWASFFQKSFFSFLVGYSILFLWVFLGIRAFVSHRKFNSKEFFLGMPFISGASLLLIWIFFSFQVNEETRYLLPALPYFIILLCYWVYQIKSVSVKYIFILLFSIQFLMMQGISFGLIEKRPNSSVSTWLTVPNTNTTQKNDVEKIIENTCTPESINGVNIVGVELPYMNANSLSYYSDQERLYTGRTCYYTSLGYAENDVNKAMKRLYEINPPYFVGFIEKDIPQGDAFNAVSVKVLRIIEKDGVFSESKNFESDSIRIFKNLFTE